MNLIIGTRKGKNPSKASAASAQLLAARLSLELTAPPKLVVSWLLRFTGGLVQCGGTAGPVLRLSFTVAPLFGLCGRDRVRLEDLTWKEVEAYLRSNRHMIVPVGTCEQHDPHLPLNTDTLVANRLAEYLSEQTGILVGPTLTMVSICLATKDAPGRVQPQRSCCKVFSGRSWHGGRRKGSNGFSCFRRMETHITLRLLKQSIRTR